MHPIQTSDPLVWLLASYLLGTLACGAWTLVVQALRAVPWHGRRDPAR